MLNINQYKQRKDRLQKKFGLTDNELSALEHADGWTGYIGKKDEKSLKKLDRDERSDNLIRAESIAEGGVLGLGLGTIARHYAPTHGLFRVAPLITAPAAAAVLAKLDIDSEREHRNNLNSALDKLNKKASDRTVDLDDAKAIAAGLGAAGGAGLIRDAYRSGQLTGRMSLLHGTSDEAKKKILEEGMKGTSLDRAVITNMHSPDVVNKSLGKSFTTDLKQMAAQYAIQAEAGGHGRLEAAFKAHPIQTIVNGIKSLLGNYGIVHINVPVSEVEKRRVVNPMVEGELKEYITPNMSFRDKADIRHAFFNARDHHFVLEGDISNKFMPESKHYIKNSIPEFVEYVKTHPKMFAKGLAKTTAGLGTLAGAAYIANQLRKADA